MDKDRLLGKNTHLEEEKIDNQVMPSQQSALVVGLSGRRAEELEKNSREG